MKTKLLAGIGLSACALGFAAKDKVVMRVNGVDVPKSEFEYLYNKNSQQQITSQPLEEYVEMFKLYKLKVADAKAEGLDTTASFKKEMRQYRAELSAPYLVDSVYINSLVDETYKRSEKEAEAYHIMMMKSRDGKENKRSRQLLDSLRGELKKGASFSELARKYSQDKSAVSNGGYLGYIQVNHFPYLFEKTVFELPEGEISEIVESPVGYHLLKGGKKRKARGQVLVSHIMKRLDPKADDAVKEETKRNIDSIYNVVIADPSKFAEMARLYSDDRGTARMGGQLPWFGSGEMVQEFDSVAFRIPVGAISSPFKTSYGWHFIQKNEARENESLEEMKPNLINRMSVPQDERFAMIRNHQNERIGKKHNLRPNRQSFALMSEYISSNGLDSLFYVRFGNGKEASAQLFLIDKVPTTVGEFADYLNNATLEDPEAANKMLENSYEAFLNMRLLDAERKWLEDNVADYRNLMKEYEEGTLLYDVSVRKVWDKAAKDQQGLDDYFNRHRDDYHWQQPHVKGYLIQASSDSVANLVKERLPQLGSDSIVRTIRKEFPKVVQIDKVLVEKGHNQMVDYLIFGGPEYQPQAAKYKSFFMFDARILNDPEDSTDVKGLVTSDYQNELQKAWEEELLTKYPVVVNEKELRGIKTNR